MQIMIFILVDQIITGLHGKFQVKYFNLTLLRTCSLRHFRGGGIFQFTFWTSCYIVSLLWSYLLLKINRIIITGCIKKLYTLGFELISQLKIHFQQRFCIFSMCQTRAVTKNIQIFIPTTKSDKDIEGFVKNVKKRNEQDSSLFSIILFMLE
jgi:hypothetical protein